MAFLQLLYKLQKLISNKKMTASYDTKFFLSNKGIFCISKKRVLCKLMNWQPNHFLTEDSQQCVCVCVFVCLSVCVCVFECVCLLAVLCSLTLPLVCVCVCVFVCVSVCVCLFECVCFAAVWC